MSNLIINFGSINIDHVYRVPHFVQPGETLNSSDLNTGLGGKGANQSVAIARAGGNVLHVGQIGIADQWALDVLQDSGVNIEHIHRVEGASGHAIIQVNDEGENAILLHGGANRCCDPERLRATLEANRDAAYLLLQNECNGLEHAMALANALGIRIAFNPAPMTRSVQSLPLDSVSVLIVNQIEAQGLSGASTLDDILAVFHVQYPNTKVVITLGGDGAVLQYQGQVSRVGANEVDVLDTTGAGDTFVGYFLQALVEGKSDEEALKTASAAAALTVTKPGAIDAIPSMRELQNA